MLIMPAWAMIGQLGTWYEKEQYVLLGVAVVTLVLEAWMIVEAVLVWPKAKGVLEEKLPPLPNKADMEGGAEVVSLLRRPVFR